MPRAIVPLVLSQDHQEQLERWLGALGTPQQVALRCRIVLGIAAGKAEVVVGRREQRESQDRSPVAGAFPRARIAGTMGDCSGSRKKSDL